MGIIMVISRRIVVRIKRINICKVLGTMPDTEVLSICYCHCYYCYYYLIHTMLKFLDLSVFRWPLRFAPVPTRPSCPAPRLSPCPAPEGPWFGFPTIVCFLVFIAPARWHKLLIPATDHCWIQTWAKSAISSNQVNSRPGPELAPQNHGYTSASCVFQQAFLLPQASVVPGVKWTLESLPTSQACSEMGLVEKNCNPPRVPWFPSQQS